MNERFFEVFQAIFGLAQRIRPSKTDKLRNFTGYFGYITAVSERSPRYKPANTRHPAQARDSFKIQWYANPKYLDLFLRIVYIVSLLMKSSKIFRHISAYFF
jgi:hypothetical protein